MTDPRSTERRIVLDHDGLVCTISSHGDACLEMPHAWELVNPHDVAESLEVLAAAVRAEIAPREDDSPIKGTA